MTAILVLDTGLRRPQKCHVLALTPAHVMVELFSSLSLSLRIDKFLLKSHFPVFLTQFLSCSSCPVQCPKPKKELPIGVCPHIPRRTGQPAPSAGGQRTPPLSGPDSPVYPGPCNASPNPTQHFGAAGGSLPQAGRSVKAPEAAVSGGVEGTQLGGGVERLLKSPFQSLEVILFGSVHLSRVQAGSLRQLISPTSGMVLCKSLRVSLLHVRQVR